MIPKRSYEHFSDTFDRVIILFGMCLKCFHAKSLVQLLINSLTLTITMDTASTPMNEQQSARGQLIVTSRRSQTQHTDTIPRSSRSSSHNSGIQNFEAKLQNVIDLM